MQAHSLAMSRELGSHKPARRRHQLTLSGCRGTLSRTSRTGDDASPLSRKIPGTCLAPADSMTTPADSLRMSRDPGSHRAEPAAMQAHPLVRSRELASYKPTRRRHEPTLFQSPGNRSRTSRPGGDTSGLFLKYRELVSQKPTQGRSERTLSGGHRCDHPAGGQIPPDARDRRASQPPFPGLGRTGVMKNSQDEKIVPPLDEKQPVGKTSEDGAPD